MAPPNQQNSCSNCAGKDYCDEHKLVLAQLDNIKNIPTIVSRMSGTLAILGVLIITAVGIIFNAYIESKKSSEVYATKIDSISTQISKLENETAKSISALKSDIVRINVNLEQIQKDTVRDNARRNNNGQENR